MEFNIRDVNLKLIDANSCGDFILYYDIDGKNGFEAQFDNGKFNGKIYFCENIGDDDEEEWNIVTDKEIFEFIKLKALQDYI